MKMWMESKIKCKICGKFVSKGNAYLTIHIKRKHNISLEEYVIKYYDNLDCDFRLQKCGFCYRDAEYKLLIDHDNMTYKKYYNGFLCDTIECKKEISLSILGNPYDKKKYEKVGSKSEYISKKYKISLDDAKLKKYKPRKILESHKSSLNGFILRHGKKEGMKKYKERCEKISKSNKKEWYIEKYGNEIGNKKWKEYIDKLKKSSGNKVSKASLKIKNILENLKIDYEMEFNVLKTKFSDYYLKEYNTIIEFYGDYWHCNPLIYDKDYYHQYIKKNS
jgi:hypothetical protein